MPPFPNLIPYPTMIEKNPKPTDLEWRQYPCPHVRNPEETHSKRRRARSVDIIEEIIEEQNHERFLLWFLFSSLVQRHRIHYGHSLFVSQTGRRTTGRGHSQRKSVKHNVFAFQRWSLFLSLVRLGLLFSFLQHASCSPSLSPLL